MSTPNPDRVVDDAARVAKAIIAQPKSFYKSKRFWVALVATVLHAIGYLPAEYAIAATFAANLVSPIIDRLVSDLPA